MATRDFLTYPITATGSTTGRTVPNRLAEVKNVKDWGATGNGSTDDWSHIQAAVDETISVGGSGTDPRGVIYFPPGTYRVSQPIRYDDIDPVPVEHSVAIIFRGEGKASKIVGNFSDYGVIHRYTLEALSPYGGAGTSLGPGQGPCIIENLWVHQENPDGWAIFQGQCILSAIRNCTVTTAGHGICCPNDQGWIISNCSVVSTGAGTPRMGISSGENGAVKCCTIDGFTSGFMPTGNGTSTFSSHFKNCDVAYDSGQMIPVFLPDFTSTGGNKQSPFAVIGCLFEDNGVAMQFRSSGSGVIAANTIIGSTGATYGIKQTADQIVVWGNTISGDFSTAAVQKITGTSALGQMFAGVTADNTGAGDDWAAPSSPASPELNVFVNSNHRENWIYIQLPGVFDATHNHSRIEGATYNITDCNTNVWGATAGGSGSHHAKVRWNGSNWTVVGI